MLWLEEYLTRWKKTLVVVSHDRDFLNTVTTDIIHLHDARLHYYRGNFAQVRVRACAQGRCCTAGGGGALLLRRQGGWAGLGWAGLGWAGLRWLIADIGLMVARSVISPPPRWPAAPAAV